MLPTGTIYLCSNVPLTNSYEHTIDFSNTTEQLSYFIQKQVKTIENTQYVRKGQSIVVPFALDEIKGVNYLYCRGKSSSKWHYYFVTNKQYNDEKTTYLTLELDVMQTYMFDYKINPSYIKREHTDRWDGDYDPIFSITDEGLDYGSDYVTEKAYKVDNGDLKWLLVVLKVGDTVKRGSADSSTNATGGVNNYVTCLVPFTFNEIKNGLSTQYQFVDHYTEDIHTILSLEDLMYKMTTTSMGESIVEMTYCPYIPYKYTLREGIIYWEEKAMPYAVYLTTGETYLMGMESFETGTTLVSFDYLYGLIRPKKADWDKVKANPLKHPFDRKWESKLLTYPYRYNLLTNWKDNPVEFKNEHLPKTCKIKMTKGFGFNAPCRYWIDNYMLEQHGRGHALVENAATDFPVVSNEYASYMYNNKNTLKQNQINQAVNVLNSGYQGFTGGGLAGGIGGAIGAGVSAYQNLASENAKQKDLARLPSSYINSQDSKFTIVDDNLYLTFYRYRIPQKDQERLAWYWHMYGYKSGVVKEPDIRSRNRFNFIQTIGANITGNFDQEDILKIKTIFDNGITFWHYNKTNFYPGDYRYGNYETSLL